MLLLGAACQTAMSVAVLGDIAELRRHRAITGAPSSATTVTHWGSATQLAVSECHRRGDASQQSSRRQGEPGASRSLSTEPTPPARAAYRLTPPVDLARMPPNTAGLPRPRGEVFVCAVHTAPIRDVRPAPPGLPCTPHTVPWDPTLTPIVPNGATGHYGSRKFEIPPFGALDFGSMRTHGREPR
jgi:hypothetical protein